MHDIGKTERNSNAKDLAFLIHPKIKECATGLESCPISMQKLKLKKEKHFKSMGAFGIGERNERGNRLIEFAEEHKLIITNTLFQKPKKLDTGLGSNPMGKQETKQILH